MGVEKRRNLPPPTSTTTNHNNDSNQEQQEPHEELGEQREEEQKNLEFHKLERFFNNFRLVIYYKDLELNVILGKMRIVNIHCLRMLQPIEFCQLSDNVKYLN
jgi:hypothetical protein